MRTRFLVLAVTVALTLGVANATTYTQDSNLSDFTNGLSNYATFTMDQIGDQSLPFTPNAASLAAGYRFIGNDLNPPVVAEFNAAVSNIVVFPNIDHLGSSFDGYQYTIYGSNDGVNYTLLFDALTVVGSGEPFQLGNYVGTAPYLVNNVITPGQGPGGTVGYEAYFSFGQAYKYYEFGASTVAVNSGNPDQELSAIAEVVPEPGTLLLLGGGLFSLGAAGRRKFF